MAQESTAFRRDNHSRNSHMSWSRTSTRSPSPALQRKEHQSHHESLISESIAQDDATPPAEGASLLGSMWNLVRDARDVAAREFDKLFDHFPYKSGARPNASAEDNAHKQDRMLAVRKPRSSASVLTASTTPQPKSLLGHGPVVKQRGQPLKQKHRALTKKFLDQDLMYHVNDVSPLNQLRVSSSATVHLHGHETGSSIKRVRYPSPSGSETHSDKGKLQQPHKALLVHHGNTVPKRLTQTLTSGSDIPPIIGRLQTHKTWPGNHEEIPAKRTRHPSSSESDMQPSPEQRTPLRSTPTPSLKRDSSYVSYSLMRRPQSAILDSDDLASSVDGRQDDEDSDNSDYRSAVSRRRRFSREPSETPSIASATGTLSISGNAKSLQSTHNRHSHHHLQQPRPSQYLQHRRHLGAIYPQNSSSRAGSTTGSDIHPAIADSQNDPFLNSRGPSPLPPPFPDIYPEQHHVRSSSQSSTIENQKLNELQQELAVIKEQLRSLVSARQDDLQRSQLSPVNFNSVPPPPPPPPLQISPSVATPKKWTPPQTEAGLSMQNVLKELSSQKVKLRKTGSPFVSRISSAVDNTTSSPYTGVTIKSRSEPEATTRPNPPSALTKRQRGSSKGG